MTTQIQWAPTRLKQPANYHCVAPEGWRTVWTRFSGSRSRIRALEFTRAHRCAPDLFTSSI